MKEKGNRINIHSMRFRVFMYCIILTLVPVFIVFCVTYRTSYGIIRKQTYNSEKLLLSQICSNISSRLNKVKLSADAVISNADILRALRTYRYMDLEAQELNAKSEASLKSYAIIDDIISSIYIKTEEGKEMYFGLPYSAEHMRERFSPIMERYKEGGSKWIYLPAESSEDEDQLIYMVPFDDYYKGGTKMGTMVISVRTTIFQQVFSEITRTKRGEYFVVDESDTLIYGEEELYQKISRESWEFDESDFKIITVDGKKTVMSYRTVEKTDWKLISEVPAEVYLSDLIMIQKTVFITFFISLFLAACMTRHFSPKFMHPVNLLVEEMKEVEKGNFEIQSNFYPKDEIGYLREQFEKMIKEIKELMERISQKEREKRIAEINALQAQIHPHFLYNTLNSVYCLAQINGQEKISRIVSSLSEMLRMSVGNPDEFVVRS